MRLRRSAVLGLLSLCLLLGVTSPGAWAEGVKGLADTAMENVSADREQGESAEPVREKSEWARWEHVAERPAPGETRFYVLPFKWAIRFFRRFVSPVDGPSCDFSPTCSGYGMKAVDKHGLMGIPMATERIMRNHHPDNPVRYPIVEHGDGLYYADPVEANDFWWGQDP